MRRLGAGKALNQRVLFKDLICVYSGEENPTCGTFLYSTTTSETSTIIWCNNFNVSGIATACVSHDCGPVTATLSSTVEVTKTITASPGTDGSTNPTVTTSSNSESSASDTHGSSPGSVTDAISSRLDTKSPDYTSRSVASTTTQTASGPPVGLIVGGTLGGLAIAAVVVVALVWLLCVRRRDGRSGKGQPSEPVNEQRIVSGGVSQLEGNSLKPELSALSPATVPSFMSLPPVQQEQPSLGDGCMETRHELSAGKD